MIEYSKRIYKVLKKVPALAPEKREFGANLTKLINSSQTRLQDTLPQAVLVEHDQIDAVNEELWESHQLWNEQSLCYRFVSVIREYKSNKLIQTNWFKLLKSMSNGQTVNEKGIRQIEKSCGIDLK